MGDNQGFIPPHGGYENLVSYQKAEIVYDATIQFCSRCLEKRDRTCDQMIQAARSAKQNIIEGSMASATSKETEIKLTNVARASLEELLEDYRDFLRSRQAPVWPKDSKEALYVRRLSRQATPGPKHGTYETKETHGTSAADSARSLPLPNMSHSSLTSHSPTTSSAPSSKPGPQRSPPTSSSSASFTKPTTS